MRKLVKSLLAILIIKHFVDHEVGTVGNQLGFSLITIIHKDQYQATRVNFFGHLASRACLFENYFYKITFLIKKL